VSVQVDSCR